MTIKHLTGEVDWLMDWIDAQYDAGRLYPDIKEDAYYKQLVAVMHEARVTKWGRCADCSSATSTCITEMMATGRQIEICPLGGG